MVNSQGTKVYASDGVAVYDLGCLTMISPISDPIGVVDQTPLGAAAKTGAPGFITPGQFSASMFYDGLDTSQAALFAAYKQRKTLTFVILLSDSDEPPTISGETITPPQGRTSITFDGWLVDRPLTVAMDKLVSLSISVYRTNAATLVKPSDIAFLSNFEKQVFFALGLPVSFAQQYTLTRSTPRYVWDASGQLVSIAANQPCYEYDPATGAAKGLFLNPESVTNLLSWSEGDSTKFPSKSGDYSDVSGFGGADNAIHFAAGTSTYCYQSAPTTTGKTYTISALIKMDDGLIPIIGSSSSTGDFTLVAGNSGAYLNRSVMPVGGGVYLCKASVVGSGGSNAGVIKYSAQSSRSFTFTRLMAVEESKGADHYIKTTGVSATCAADVCDLASLPSDYDTTGCFVINYSDPFVGSAIREMLGDGTSAFFQLSADNLTVSATDGTNTASTSVTATGKNKVAVAWDSTTLKICANGGTVVTATHNGNLGSFASPPRLARGVAAWYSLLQYLPSTNTGNVIATDSKMQELTA